MIFPIDVRDPDIGEANSAVARFKTSIGCSNDCDTEGKSHPKCPRICSKHRSADGQRRTVGTHVERSAVEPRSYGDARAELNGGSSAGEPRLAALSGDPVKRQWRDGQARPLATPLASSLEILHLTLQVNNLPFECFDLEIEPSEFVSNTTM